jgi:hypothetical protein
MGRSEISQGKKRIADPEGINRTDFAKEQPQSKVTDIMRQVAYEAKHPQQALEQKIVWREGLFKGEQKLSMNRTDVLPQPKDEDSLHASIRVVLHTLGKIVPETISTRRDPDYRHFSVDTRISRLQSHGAETLKKYLKPVEAPAENSTQSRSRFTKWSERVRNQFPSTKSDGPFKATYVNEKRSAEQLREALDKGPVIYDIRASKTDWSGHHIAILDYRGSDITYADNGKLYHIPDKTFFENSYQQYGNRVLVALKQESPAWKTYQQKLRASLETQSDSQQQDRGEGPSQRTVLD